MTCRKEAWYPRNGPTPDPVALVTALAEGTVNAFTAVADLVLTSDGVTAGGVWQLVVNANIDPAANIAVTKLAPGAINTTLQTNGAGNIVWGAAGASPLVTAGLQGEVNAFTAAPNLVLQSDGVTAGGVWRNFLELPAAGYVQLGLAAGSGAGSAAATGGVRLQGNSAVQGRIVFRNSTDTGDLAGISAVANDIYVGGSYPVLPTNIQCDASTAFFMRVGGAHKLYLTNTFALFNTPTVTFDATQAAPKYTQDPNTAAGATAADLGFVAQSATGGGASVGGTAYLQGGTGATNGAAELRDSAGTMRLRAVAATITGNPTTDYDWQVNGTTELTVGVGYIAHSPSGGTVAGQGNFRVDKDWAQVARNDAGAGDISMFWMGAANDKLYVGDAYGTATAPTEILVSAVNSVALYSTLAGNIALANTTGLHMYKPLFEFVFNLASPVVTQADDATAGVIADDLGVIAQSATGGGASVGGTAYLQGGRGTTLGLAEMRDANGTPIVVADATGATVNGKLTVTGLIDPTGLVLDEQATVPGGAPGAGKGTFWVKDDAPSTPYFTDDAGTDFQLAVGAGSLWQTTGSEVEPIAGAVGVRVNNYLVFGDPANAASGGQCRLPQVWSMDTQYRMGWGSVGMLSCDANNYITLGGPGVGSSRPRNIYVDAHDEIFLQKNGANKIWLGAYNLYDNVSHQFFCGGAARFMVYSAYIEHSHAGFSPASQGVYRTEKNWSLVAKDDAASGDVSMLWMGAASDDLTLGGVFGTAARPSNIDIDAVTAVAMQVGGTDRISTTNGTSTVNPSTTIELKVNGTIEASCTSNGLYAERSWRRKHYDVAASDSPYSVAEGYSVLKVDCSGGEVTINLPAVASSADRILVIKDASGDATANNITIDGNGAETIDGALTAIINTDGGAVTLHCDGVEWSVI